MQHTKALSAVFSFPGFRARSQLQGIFGDPHARLVVLVRRKKRRCAPAAGPDPGRSTTVRRVGCGIPMRPAGVSTWRLSNGASRVPAVAG